MSELKHKICPKPFSEMFLQSSGKVFPCNFLQNNKLVGDVKNQSLQEIWHSDQFSNFRKEHLAGNCGECQVNQEKFECHLSDQIEIPSEQYAPIPIQPPLKLDFMIDSYCNLKCIMCTNIYEDNGGFEDPLFWEQASKQIFPYLKEMEIIGGEPFLVANTYKLIDCVNLVNPDCEWVVTTNASYRLNDKMKQAIKKINLKLLGLSIDSLKEDVFAKIRLGGSLSKVLSTLDDFIELRDEQNSFRIECNSVIQQDNAYEVPRLIEFSQHKKITPYLILLKHPMTFSIFQWKEKELATLFEFYLASYRRNENREFYKFILKVFKSLPVELRLKYAQEVSDLGEVLKTS